MYPYIYLCLQNYFFILLVGTPYSWLPETNQAYRHTQDRLGCQIPQTTRGAFLNSLVLFQSHSFVGNLAIEGSFHESSTLFLVSFQTKCLSYIIRTVHCQLAKCFKKCDTDSSQISFRPFEKWVQGVISARPNSDKLLTKVIVVVVFFSQKSILIKATSHKHMSGEVSATVPQRVESLYISLSLF